MAIEIGKKAKLVAPVISGEVVDTKFDKDAKQLSHMLEWSDGNGTHTRWFLESELAEVSDEK